MTNKPDPEYREYSYYMAEWNDNKFTATTYDEDGEEYNFDASSEVEAETGIKNIIDKLLDGAKCSLADRLQEKGIDTEAGC